MRPFTVLLVPLFMVWTVSSNNNKYKCPDITDKRTCTNITGNCLMDKDCEGHQICCDINSCINQKICHNKPDLSKSNRTIQKLDQLSGRPDISRTNPRRLTSEQILPLLDRYIPIDRVKNMIVYFKRPFFFNSSFLELFWGLKNSTEQALLFLDKIYSLKNSNPKLQSTFNKKYLQILFSRLTRIRSGRSAHTLQLRTNTSREGKTNLETGESQNNQTNYEALVEVVRRCCKGRVCLRVCNIDETASDTFQVLSEVAALSTQNETQKAGGVPSITSRIAVRSIVDNQTVPVSSLGDRITPFNLSNILLTGQRNLDSPTAGTDTMLTQLRNRVKFLEEQLLERDRLINNLFNMINRNQIAPIQPGRINLPRNRIRVVTISRDNQNTRTGAIIQPNQNQQRQTLLTSLQTNGANNQQQIQQVVSTRQTQPSANIRQFPQTATVGQNQQQNQRLRQLLRSPAQMSLQQRQMPSAQRNAVNSGIVPISQTLPTQMLNTIEQTSPTPLLPSISVRQTAGGNDENDDQTRNTVLNLPGNRQMVGQSTRLNGDVGDSRLANRSPGIALPNQQTSSLSINVLRNQQILAEQVRQIQQQQQLLLQNNLQGQLLQNNPSVSSLLNLQAQQQLQSTQNPLRTLELLQLQQQQQQQQPQTSLNLLRLLGGNPLQNPQLTNLVQLQQLLQANQQRTVQTAPADTNLLQNVILNSVLNQQQQQQQQQQLLLPTDLAQNIQNIARLSPRLGSQADLLIQQQELIPQTINRVGQLSSVFPSQLENTELQQLAQILQNRQLLLNQPSAGAASQLSLLQPPALTVISNDQIQQLLPSIGSVQSGLVSPLLTLQAQNQLLDNSLQGLSILG